jgi:hypothetical protein
MIKYALVCDQGHAFESWFPNSDAYDTQARRGLVDCPHCGSIRVSKALMAPSVSTSKRRDRNAAAQVEPLPAAPVPAPEPPQPVALLDERQLAMREMIRELHAKIAETTVDVGAQFAEEARKMHQGDAPERPIRGRASLAEAKELWEEGISVMPIPSLPEERN